MPAASRHNALTEAVVYVFNPLPSIDDAAILQKAGLDLAEPSKIPPFRLVFEHGSGFEGQRIVLDPGTFAPMRKHEADELLAELQERGAVAVVDPNDSEEVRAATTRGVRAAIRYWSARGNPRIAWYRKERGFSQQEVDEMRHNLHPWYTAQARADLLADSLRHFNSTKAAKGSKLA